MTASPLSRHRAAGPVWIVVPTYNEVENLERLTADLMQSVPDALLLVVDDSSPDGTGDLADRLAVEHSQVSVLHRRAKEGLGPAYREGMERALDAGAEIVVQMDCDFSHDPAAVPALLAALLGGADLALGSRYIPGGGTAEWGRLRQVVSRGGNTTARRALGMPYRDVTGGFKAWRAATLRAIDLASVPSNGYGFQIEMTWRAYRTGAVVAEVPIMFRDRQAGVSKMTAGIAGEALRMLVRLRLDRFGDLDNHSPAPDVGWTSAPREI
jgi:dolichol-phosphate mannosyltransferase